MSDNVQIISKGLYRGDADNAFPVEVTEYVFTRKKGKKYLLLRFFNRSTLNVTAIHFLLIQKDSHGEQISKEKIVLEGLYCAEEGTYSPSSGFMIQDNCAEFEVKMVSVFSGEYEYKAENGEGFVRFPIK